MEKKYLYNQAKEALLNAKRVVVVSHKNPDGDTIGAATAVMHMCRAEGIDAYGFCADAIPEPYRFMQGSDRFTDSGSIFIDPVPCDVVFVVDVGEDLAYAGVDGHISRMEKRPVIVNIDHHVTNGRFGDINIVDENASSAAELVHDLLSFCGKPIDSNVATSLLSGIIHDTDNFSNGATTISALASAAELVRSGAKIQDISRRLLRNKPVPALRLWGTVLDRIKKHKELGVASTALFAKDLNSGEIDEEHVAGLSNFLNKFLDVKVVLVLKETDDGHVKGSFRTISEDINVARLAQRLGGGGHRKAAGFMIPGRIVECEDCWRVE